MMKIGTIFKFATPEGWSQFQEGNRHIFHGPNREELIVSASLVQGIGKTGDLAAAQQRLFKNAEHAAKSAAAHPALKVTQPFQEDRQASKVECWSLHAQTHDGGTLFYQAVFHDLRGVLLATFEAPNTARSIDTFEQFIKSVEVTSESETLVE